MKKILHCMLAVLAAGLLAVLLGACSNDSSSGPDVVASYSAEKSESFSITAGIAAKAGISERYVGKTGVASESQSIILYDDNSWILRWEEALKVEGKTVYSDSITAAKGTWELLTGDYTNGTFSIKCTYYYESSASLDNMRGTYKVENGKLYLSDDEEYFTKD